MELVDLMRGTGGIQSSRSMVMLCTRCTFASGTSTRTRISMNSAPPMLGQPNKIDKIQN